MKPKTQKLGVDRICVPTKYGPFRAEGPLAICGSVAVFLMLGYIHVASTNLLTTIIQLLSGLK